VPFGQVTCYQVRRRVEVGRDKHVQDGASTRIQPCRDRMTGCQIELFFVAKPGSADVNCYAVEAARLGREILLEIFDEAGNFLRYSEEALGEVEADRIVVDDGHALARTCQHRREVSSATTKQEDIFGVAQKGFHHFHVWQPALASRRALALKDLSLAIKSVAGPFALPDRDVTQLTFISTENLQGTFPLIVMYLT